MSTISYLRRIDLFDGSSPSELGTMARMFERIAVRPGDALEVQDAPVRWWHVIAGGHAVVERDGTPLGLLGAGASWSEHSLFNHDRSPIGVVALSPVTVLALDARRFFALLDNFPAVGARVVARAASSADRLALPVYRALVHMDRALLRPRPAAARYWA
ncbi:MAG TPA: cyclic nucleotide-binding domain-containing protein [Acidimicrobiales bacterium]|nr:cyclic nucleotide-binding domain-containing protein [Acidimicrobiales bacterium]